MTDLQQALDRIKSRWMVGGSAVDQASPELKAVADLADIPDLALLAVAAQAGQVAFRPAPAAGLTPLPVLPRLELPMLPERHRPAFRRFFKLSKISTDEAALLLQFLACRGYTVHPADYMPPRFDDLPPCYSPWEGWGEPEVQAVKEDLGEHSWDDYLPRERLYALQELRERDGTAARDLIAAKVVSMPAEQRCKVIAVLETGLHQDDTAFLETLRQNDRSAKVQALAAALLARLGAVLDEAETAKELADFLEVGKKGLINRKTIVNTQKLKTGAQKTRRTELFGIVSMPGLAEAVGLTAEALVSGWQLGSLREDAEFCSLVARTGALPLVSALTNRVLSETSVSTEILLPLLDRLEGKDKWERLPALLEKEPLALQTLMRCADGNLGRLGLPTLASSKFVRSLLESTKAQAADTAKPHQAAQLQTQLFHLGLLADQDAAQNLIQSFIEAEMSRSDPALLMLQFNAALTSGVSS
ncbi:DUF5691 domain-containing protein [Roseibium sp. M-1]